MSEGKNPKGYHVCLACRETVYCEDDDCAGLPSGLCDECFLHQNYKHEKKSGQ